MPKTRTGGALKLMLVFALEIAFIAVFHLLGNVHNMGIDFSNFSQWIDITPPEVALVASIRLLALMFSYWLLGTSVIYMIARALHMTKLLRGLELITLPGVRRAIDAGLAATIIGGTVFGGAGAVFAQTSHSAQTHGAPAAVTAQYQDLRGLYNPTPAGDSAPVSAAPAVQDATQTPSQTQSPAQDVSSNVSVQAPVQTPSAAPAQAEVNYKVAMPSAEAPQSQSGVQTPTAATTAVAPVQDANGNYIPQPAGGPTTTTTSTTTTDPSSPSSSKVVVTTPSGTDTSTTLPKVAVPSSTTPVTTPLVDIAGKQVQQPNDTPAQTPAAQTQTSYTVVPGDNFWAIAKAQVQSNLGHEPTNAEVANYWVKLIDANKASIRSGDPDLIFPGEVFTLPPI